MAYVASFYLTISLHISPIKYSGKVIDIYMLLEYQAIDHILLGLLQTYKNRILSAPSPNSVLEFFKYDLMKESLKSDNMGGYINQKSLDLLMGNTSTRRI